MRRLRILTWHVHGSYLWSLVHIGHDLFLPTKPGRPHGYGGRAGSWVWPPNVHEVPLESVPSLDPDVVLYQSHQHWLVDRHELLSPVQRRVPQIFLEHDPPRESPTDTRHPVDDPNALIVHVTHFNELMWDTGTTPTRVIEHGVTIPDHVRHDPSSKRRGIVIANGLGARGRRLGADIYEAVAQCVPLDLIGIDAHQSGGLGEIDPPDVAEFLAPYRFYFHPVRYTSLGLSLCEAMAVGVPVVGLATTELATVVQDGVTGFVDTNVRRLIEVMRELLDDPVMAHQVGCAGRAVARERFGIDRFVRDWDKLLTDLTE